MRVLLWIVHHARVYALGALMVALFAAAGVGYVVQRDRAAERDITLSKGLTYFASSIEGGTTDSRPMGAIVLMGLSSPEMKKIALGQLPRGDAGVRARLETLRTLFFAGEGFVVDSHGVIAAYSSETRIQGEGKDISFRPYVQTAMKGTANVYPAVGSNSNTRGIYLAAPLRSGGDEQSEPVGVVALKIGSEKLDRLLDTWSSGPAVLLSPQGVIFASNRKGWIFRLAGPGGPERLAQIRQSRQFGKVFEADLLPPLPFTAKSTETELEGVRYDVRNLPLEWDDPAGEWNLLILDARRAWWSQWEIVASAFLGGLIAASLFFWVFALARNAFLQQKAHQATQDMQRRLLELTDNAPVAVFKVRVGPYGKADFEFISRRVRDIVGVDHETLTAESGRLLDHVPDEERDAYRETLAAAIGAGEAWDTEFRIRTGDGVRWVHSAAYPMVDADGHINYNGFLEDITQRKASIENMRMAREIAEEATKSKSEFLANMSHESRTPMNGVIGMAYLALKTKLSPTQRDYVSKIHHAGKSLLGIINDILDFSKIEAGKLSMEHTDFDLEEIVSNTTALIGHAAADKKLGLAIDLDAGVPRALKGDPLRLGQVLTNLLNNAVKFTERGEVRLSASVLEQSGERVKLRFSIQDTGIGMSAEQARQLFQPFVQADSSTSRKYGGTGLGLTISKRLVELMEGDIRVDSQPGVGSTFSFTAWFGIGSGVRSDAQRSPVRHDLGGMRVLLAEDNDINRQIVVELLSGVGARVDVACNGREVVDMALARSEPYDLILMDLQMPEMDGFEAARRLRAETRTAATPILALSAHAQAADHSRCLELGMNGLIVKPIDPDLLYATLAQWRPERGRPEMRPVATPSTEGIPVIPGIEVAAGVRRAGDQLSLYAALLEQFCSQHGGATKDIEAALAAGAPEDALLHTHTVRGVAANLGALALADAAGALESAFRAQSGDISPLLARFSATLNDTVSAIQGWLDSRPGEIPDTDALPGENVLPLNIAGLEALVCLLENDDGLAVDCFKSLRPELAARMDRAELEALADAMARYDFAAALEHLRAVA